MATVDAEPKRATPSMARKLTILGAAITAIALTILLVRFDEKREEDLAFDDLALEQSRLAMAVSSSLGGRLDAIVREARSAANQGESRAGFDGSGYVEIRAVEAPDQVWQEADAHPTVGDALNAVAFSISSKEGRRWEVRVSLAPLLKDVGRIERPGELVLLVMPPDRHGLITTDVRPAAAERLVNALATNASSFQLARDEAAALGLHPRAASAGLSRIDAGPLGHWGVAVVASASREREREFRSRVRLIGSASFAGGLVFLFGVLSLRRQAKDLDYERELALLDLQQRLDARLVRASRAAMMGTFATGVAHEISTPLGIIVGRAEQLEGRLKEDERSLRNTRSILEQADRISGVVRGFLNMARGGDPNLSRANPTDLAAGAVRLVQHRFEKAGVELVTNFHQPTASIHCDERLFEHALVNLLLNACEACERGGRVEIAVRSDNERVGFVVSDNGSGIPQEDAARAIEPFFTTKPVGQGTGLGLAITHEIVKAHRGELEIQPNDPLGTRVIIEVPVAGTDLNDDEK